MFELFCMFLDCGGDITISKYICDVVVFHKIDNVSATFECFALCCAKSFETSLSSRMIRALCFSMHSLQCLQVRKH